MPKERLELTPQTAQTMWLSVVGLCFGIAIGVKFADIDLRVPNWLLYHRALLTHGAIVPMLVAGWCWFSRHQTVRGFTIGFAVANAVHLSFDLFPKAWWGHALIHVFTWAFPPILSWCWIAASIVCCLYLARYFIRTIWDIVLSLSGILAGFVIYAHEGFLFPLIAFAVAGILAFLLPIPREATS
jgi:hypothetical protein